MSKFAVAPKKYFRKFHQSQRSSETKDIAHDDITYPICWNNYQKRAILGKSSKNVHFIFVSCLSQNVDLSLEGGGATAEQLPVLQALTQSTTGGYPACKGHFR